MKKLAQELKKVLNKKKEVLDFIIFGSTSKGNSQKSDLDVAAVIKEPINKTELKSRLEEAIPKKIDLQIINTENYENFLWIVLLREGFSVKNSCYLFELYYFKPVVLYRYSLKKLTSSRKVMFERAIKNFKDIEKLSNRVVLVPIHLSGEFNDFLKVITV